MEGFDVQDVVTIVNCVWFTIGAVKNAIDIKIACQNKKDTDDK
jgi:hypothetical protein